METRGFISTVSRRPGCTKCRRDACGKAWPLTPAAVSPSTAGGTVSIDPAGLKILSTDFRLVPLVFQIQWAEEADALADSSVDDYSYSQVWGLAANISEAEDMYETNSAFNYVVQPRAQSTSPLLPVSAQTTAAGPTTTATAPIAPGSTASSSSSSSDDSSPKSNASKRVGPLSTSALIGIIVGGVALVMLVLIVAIFCTRRHRRRPTQSHGDHDRDTQDLMADKEARAAGTAPDTPYSAESSQPRNVAPVSTGPGDGSESGDSPPAETHPAASSSSPSSSSSLSVSLHEPYAELAQEEQLNNQTASHATAGAPVSPSHDAGTEQSPLSSGGSLLPEEARPRAGGGGGSSSSKTGTPQMGSTRLLRSDTPGGRSISDYLHEDGMTEDDIRRLEAEERALDEAIEQARTDSRAGRGR